MLLEVLLDDAVDRALREDLAGGDLTTDSCVPEEARARAHAVARSALVACGGDVFARVFYRVDPGVRVECLVAEGTWVQPGTQLWLVEGSARSLLKAERTALNFAQRMSGIATQAHAFVAALTPGSTSRIADTRKTTPGLRAFERYAVRVGGAHNHRDTLGSAVMIKDNHIVAAGGISAAVQRARAHAPHTSKIEVEVENIAALHEALDVGADIVMLDNFDPAEITQACEIAKGRALVEVSGGITLKRIAELSAQGVDVISVGALTHSAPAADIALDLNAL